MCRIVSRVTFTTHPTDNFPGVESAPAFSRASGVPVQAFMIYKYPVPIYEFERIQHTHQPIELLLGL